MIEDSPVVTTPQTKRRARAGLGRGATLRRSPTITLKFHRVSNLCFERVISFWWYCLSNGNSLSDILTMRKTVYVYEHLIRPLVLGVSWFWYSSSTSGKSGEMQDSVSCQRNTFSSQQSVTKRGTRSQLIRINQKADHYPAILNNFTSRNNPSHPWQKM